MPQGPSIITSKTRKRAKPKDMLMVEHPEVGERRIVEPRQADKLLGNQHGWNDPEPADPRYGKQ